MANKWDIIGTEKPLNSGRGIPSPSADPRSGTWQKVGTEQAMSRKIIHSPSANPPQGSYQIMGSEIKLSRTAVKGWGDAAQLTMSPPAVAQSDNAAQKKGRR